MIKHFLLFFLLIVVSINFSCLETSYVKYSDTRFAMGSTLTIILFSDDKKQADNLLNTAFNLSDELEKKISSQNTDSLISILNKKKEMTLDTLNDHFTLELINDSIEYSRLTDGAFDFSLFNITDLWGFSSPKGPKIPAREEIEYALKSTGFKNVIINNNNVRLLNNVSLDFGGIAQGKIIGEIADFLIKNGVKDFLINASGDIFIKGKYQNKRLWKIAITDPFDKNNYIGSIQLKDVCIITSGDYEKFITGNDGVNYHHIIDPKTGYPAFNGVHSLTVISSNPAKTDALATALFVMGERGAIDFANQTDDVDVIVASGNENNYKVTVSKNILLKKISEKNYEFIYTKIID
ncbi:MAG: FAD:protein FMN transferase [Spirochaetes bacterium]|nr:FAD:protein FMN transferase [Spirochaetota bacterium]